MSTAIVEMYVDGAWLDITSDVYTRDAMIITRGRANESSQAAPSSCQLTINNRSGKYSPRNPLSPYYGQIGRNTPIRAGRSEPALILTGATNSRASTPDTASLDITGDIDLRIKLSMDDWTPDAFQTFIGKGGVAGQHSYVFWMTSANRLELQWSANGSTILSSTATVETGFENQSVHWVRVTLDANNGASGNTTTFYTSEDGTTWSQLGSAVVKTGTTSIFNSTTVPEIGSRGGNTGVRLVGNVYYAEIRSGINGPIVASPNFAAQAIGTTSFVDTAGAGRTWTVHSPASIGATLNDKIRFTGEVSSFPARWDTSGRDAWVPIEAAGLQRRLNQGHAAPAAGLKEFTLGKPGLQNYWPLDGAEGTTYSLDRVRRTKFFAYPTGAGRPVYLFGQEMGPYVGTGVALTTSGDGYLRGDVASAYPSIAIDWVFKCESMGVFNLVAYDYADFVWTVNFDSGVAQVSFTDPSTGPIGFSPTGVLNSLLDGQVHHVRLQLLRNGAATDWILYIDGTSVDSGTQSSYNLTGLSMVHFEYSVTGDQTPILLAHLTTWAGTTAVWPTAEDCAQAAFGYAGETAGERITRICELSSVPVSFIGDPADTTAMGAQPAGGGVLGQVQDAEATDMGILTEPRDSFGLLYRTRRSLYSQTPAVTLDYSAGHLAPPLEPVDDDQFTRNDWTVSRTDGGTVQLELATGPLSVQEPPNGVGRYDDSKTVNVQTDGQLAEIASWLLGLGTIDAPRYPSVRVNLAAPDVAGDADLIADLMSVEVGDRLVITNMEAVNVYDDVSLIVLGYQETITPVEHIITFNCAPGSPYEVAVYGESKYDTDGSELGSGVTSSATTLSVVKTGHTLWTTDAAAFPFDINVGGERMTVTNITSSTSPQSFTVTRSVNGVVKAHSAGADVRLWNTPRYAL